MSAFTAKKYRIDGKPASANDIFDHASALCSGFGRGGVCFLAEAAQILREHGHVVDHNPDYVEGGAE
jgi:hypothetical protein